ncbi:MAG: hypothetical protein AAFN77_20475 [Planctomycetota bacterium]
MSLVRRILVIGSLTLAALLALYCVTYLWLMSDDKLHTKIRMSDYDTALILLFLAAPFLAVVFAAIGLAALLTKKPKVTNSLELNDDQAVDFGKPGPLSKPRPLPNPDAPPTSEKKPILLIGFATVIAVSLGVIALIIGFLIAMAAIVFAYT